MILVDTSAWVEFFRGTEPVASRVDALLESNEVAICGPVATELRRGLRPMERDRVLPLLAGCQWLEAPSMLWEEAGDLGFMLARKGVVSKSMDLLIAAHALAHHVPMLATDRDYRHMRAAGVPLLLV